MSGLLCHFGFAFQDSDIYIKFQSREVTQVEFKFQTLI